MMSLNLGLTSDQEYSGIIGFSGKIINQEDLKSRKKSFNKNFTNPWRFRSSGSY